ncbi:MAG: Ig-like domain-containing protein [Deltaproteobacteria bacterium]|nr:Ig-like domain-containing protein [Deltaproteobacteria bacterium]
MEDAPAPQLTFAPDGVVSIDGATLKPARNGKTTLLASIEDGPTTKLAIEVFVVDSISLTCPEPCTVKVGATIKPIAAATGLGLPLVGAFAWSSSSSSVAEVDAASGSVTGKTAGAANIIAKVGDKSATVEVTVVPNVDELRLFCPWPPFVAVRKAGQAPPAEPPVSCETIVGETIGLRAEPWGGGKLQSAELLWTASSTAVTVAKGEVTARTVGGAAVEAKVGDLAVELPVSVYDTKRKRRPGAAECADSAGYSLVSPVALPLKDDAGAPVPPRAFTCANAAAAACLKSGVADIVKATTPLAPDLAAALLDHALAERGRRCCCRATP